MQTIRSIHDHGEKPGVVQWETTHMVILEKSRSYNMGNVMQELFKGELFKGKCAS